MQPSYDTSIIALRRDFFHRIQVACREKHVNFRLDSEVLFRTIAYTVRKKDIKSGNEMVMKDLDVERQDKIDC